MSGLLPFSRSVAKAGWCDCCKRTTACLSDAEVPFPDSLSPGRWRHWACFECGVALSTSRPFVPWIARTCLVACGLLSLISLAALGLWYAGKAKPGTSPAIFLVFSFLSIAATLFFVRQLRRWPAYAAGVASVTPLKGDACPICATSLVGTPPQPCHYCGVTVITQ